MWSKIAFDVESGDKLQCTDGFVREAEAVFKTASVVVVYFGQFFGSEEYSPNDEVYFQAD